MSRDDDDKPGRQITVGELKKLLAPIDDALWVTTEGCDCIGPSCGIDFYENTVIISRNDRIDRDTHEVIAYEDD